MPQFVTVCRVGEVPPGAGKEFPVGETQVAVFNIDGHFYACDDRCPHSGFSLAEGDVDGCTVTCFGHGWTFDLRTGECEQLAASVDIYPIEIVDGEVRVSIS